MVYITFMRLLHVVVACLPANFIVLGVECESCQLGKDQISFSLLESINGY